MPKDDEPPDFRDNSIVSRDALAACQSSTLRCSRQRYRKCAEWGAEIAEALDYAHVVGIVHRDIKPANLMVDAQGRIWITDFGLAQMDLGLGPTMTGDIVGTLRYMSPEQATGEKGLLDQRTDIYSLGATLYELLTLTPLHQGRDRAVLLQAILYDDPPAIRSLDLNVPADLATIIHKSIEREPRLRYQTAGEMAEDLRCFLQERPIRATPPTLVDRLRKWSRRNATLVRITAVFTFFALVMFSAMVLYVIREREKGEAERRTHRAEQELSSSASRGVRRHRYVTSINLANHAIHTGQREAAREALQGCIPDGAQEDFRGFEWYYLWRAMLATPTMIGQHVSDAYGSSLAPDGKTLATAGQDGIRIWNIETGEPIIHLKDHSSDVASVSFSSRGNWLASSSDDCTVKIWSTETWMCIKTIPHDRPVVSAVFSPDASLLATGQRQSSTRLAGQSIQFWNTSDWKSQGSALDGHAVDIEALAFNPEGNLLATAGQDGTVGVWDVASRSLRHRLDHRLDPYDFFPVTCLAFARTHPWLVAVGRGPLRGILKIWDVNSGGVIDSLPGSSQENQSVAFSPDDSLLVAGGNENRIDVFRFQPEGRYKRADVLQSTSRVWSLNFLNAAEIVSTDRNGGIRRHHLFNSPLQTRISYHESYDQPEFAFHPNGDSLYVSCNHLEEIKLSKPSDKHRLAETEEGFRKIAISENGKLLATESGDRQVTLRDLRGKLLWRTEPLKTRPLFTRFIDRDQRLILNRRSSVPSELYLDCNRRELSAGQFPGVVPGSDIEFSPDGTTYAVSSENGELQLWRGGQLLWKVNRLGRLDWRVEFSQDGRQIAACRTDGAVQVWNVDDPRSTITFVGQIGHTAFLSFSRDGKTLAGMYKDGTISFWNIATGRELMTLDAQLKNLKSFQFSPYGDAMAVVGSGAADQFEIVLWHLPQRLDPEIPLKTDVSQ